MKTIWKFPFETTDSFILNIPVGGEILSVQTQCEQPCMWVLVDPDEARTEVRTFCVHGTGHQVRGAENKEFLGTYQLRYGSLVFHLFEVKG